MDTFKESLTRVLFLLNLLYSGEYSKNEIIEEFKKNNIEIKKTSVNNYIKKLKYHNIPIVTKKIKNKNYYHLPKQIVKINQEELEASNDVKKILLAQKNTQIIKKAMSIFYKYAIFADKNNIKRQLVDFGYYSKINWALVKKLEEHCANKDIIMIDYLLQNGENKYLTIHADMIKAGIFSDKLYLSGILYNDNKISQLPVDRIFMIKKVVKSKVKFCMETKVLTYKISQKVYEKTKLDSNETISEIKNGIVTIKRPLDDTFFTVQRLMYFCPDLYYISDKKIKELVKEKLCILKESYNEEFKN